jgi:hypothetical protein
MVLIGILKSVVILPLFNASLEQQTGPDKIPPGASIGAMLRRAIILLGVFIVFSALALRFQTDLRGLARTIIPIGLVIAAANRSELLGAYYRNRNTFARKIRDLALARIWIAPKFVVARNTLDRSTCFANANRFSSRPTDA